MRPLGTFIMAGSKGGAPVELPWDQLVAREVRALGVNSHETQAVRAAVQLAETGRYPLERMLTHRLPLAQAAEGIELVRSGGASDGVVKVALDPYGYRRPSFPTEADADRASMSRGHWLAADAGCSCSPMPRGGVVASRCAPLGTFIMAARVQHKLAAARPSTSDRDWVLQGPDLAGSGGGAKRLLRALGASAR